MPKKKRLYVGEFHDDMKHGHGCLEWTANGVDLSYVGEFDSNRIEGQGVMNTGSVAV